MFKIAPLERLKISSPDLNGSAGTNREKDNGHDQVVSTDIEAAFKFLKRYERKPTTYRNYMKEVERLILWAVIEKQKPMSSLTGEDLNDFMAFLANPQPVERWGTNRKHPRTSTDWRPFLTTEEDIVDGKNPNKVVKKVSCGLSPSSRLLTRATLNSFFAWLIEYGYLVRNPVTHTRAAKKAIQEEEQKIQGQKVERFLDEEMWASFTDVIEAMPKEKDVDIEKYERAKFISSMMYFMAPRPSEIAGSVMKSFKFDGKLWWWYVLGKGSKYAKVPVPDDMLKALIRYRTFLGLTPLPLQSDDTPLLYSVAAGKAKGKQISVRQLNYILKDLFAAAADLLERRAREESDIITRAQFLTRAAKIVEASAHWGRHTSITFQIRSGIDKGIVQKNARHSDSRTTDHYTHEDEERWHRETQKLRSE